MSQYFILLSNNIPLYKYATYCLFIHQFMEIRVISIFWLLWIKLLWTFVYKFLCWQMALFFLHNLRIGLQNQMKTPCLNFLGNVRLFSKVFAPIYPTTVYKNSNLFISSPVFVKVCCFGYSLFSGWQVVTHCGIDLHAWDVLVGHLCIFFGELSIQPLSPFYNCILWFLKLFSCRYSLCVLSYHGWEIAGFQGYCRAGESWKEIRQ